MGVIDKRKIIIGSITLAIIILIGIICFRIFDEISLNKQKMAKMSQMKTVSIRTVKVERRDILPAYGFSGKLEPEWSMDVVAQTDGRIEELYVKEGDAVMPGTVLVALDARELAGQIIQAEANLLASRSSLTAAEADFHRAEGLINYHAISQQSLDDYRAKRDVAYQQVKAAEGNLMALKARLEYSKLSAVRTGLVTKLYVQEGGYARSGLPIMNIADDAVLVARLAVSDAVMKDAAVGMLVKISVSSINDEEFVCKVKKIQQSPDYNEKTLNIEAVLQNIDGRLKAGMLFEGKLMGSVRRTVLAVPKKAIFASSGKKYVFVVKPDNLVERKVVITGGSDDVWIEVKDGLFDEEVVAVTNLDKLQDGKTIDFEQ